MRHRVETKERSDVFLLGNKLNPNGFSAAATRNEVQRPLAGSVSTQYKYLNNKFATLKMHLIIKFKYIYKISTYILLSYIYLVNMFLIIKFRKYIWNNCFRKIDNLNIYKISEKVRDKWSRLSIFWVELYMSIILQIFNILFRF